RRLRTFRRCSISRHRDMLTAGPEDASAQHRLPWAGNPAGIHNMIALRNLLLPVDFSEPSLKATEYALTMARRFEATLHVLHVTEAPVVYLPMFESSPLPTREQFETYAQDRLENWIAASDSEGIRTELLWRHGKPHIEVIDYAGDNRIDLIVIGTHGR